MSSNFTAYSLYLCAGGLPNYKPRYVPVDYQMGMDLQKEDIKKHAPPPHKVQEQPQEDLAAQIKPADDNETISWSDNTASSDMLF